MADSEFDELDKAVASVLQTTPVTSDPVDDAPVEKVVELEMPPEPEPTPEPVVTRSAPAPRPVNTTRFMDVVPPTTFTPKAAPEPVVVEPITPPEPTPFVAPTPEPTPTEPLETPFLSDAKVEKRPLGAFSDTPKPADEETPVKETPVTKVETPQETALPAELHTDLLSIEATEPAVEENVPMPSIMQQYKERPNSDTQPSAAIYDTDAYAMPLHHNTKKSNGWLKVIWIAAIIVVGGGIGALFYFVVLPMLG